MTDPSSGAPASVACWRWPAPARRWRRSRGWSRAGSADEPRGENGFGYDPMFFHPPSGCTTAELTTEEKQLISHRGQAIGALLEAIRGGGSAAWPSSVDGLPGPRC